MLWSSRDAPRHPSLFITGLPRGGTTLIYQYLAHRLPVAYFTDGAGDRPDAPCLVSWVQRATNPPYRSDFKSHYGRGEGAMAPREAGALWGRYFSLDDYEIEPPSAQKRRRLLRTVRIMERVFGDVPFMNKNVKHLLRLRPLATLFPAALFLIVERSVPDVALSMHRGAREHPEAARHGWWSVKPDIQVDPAQLTLEQRICTQIAALRRRADEDVRAIGEHRFLRVRYEDFCRRPEDLIDELGGRLGLVSRRNEPVRDFPVRCSEPRTAEERALLDALEQAVSREPSESNEQVARG